MRIVSGRARGRKIFTPPPDDLTIRPTSDRAREALFNILGSFPEQTRVLDLFAGTGALGLEAFSRGAQRVVFIDAAPKARQLIQRNLTQLFAGPTKDGSLIVLNHDLTEGLPVASLLAFAPRGFDLIFADPPYGRGLSLAILTFLDNSPLLCESGLLVVEDRFSVSLPKQLMRLQQIDQRRYGEAGLWLYRHCHHTEVIEEAKPTPQPCG